MLCVLWLLLRVLRLPVSGFVRRVALVARGARQQTSCRFRVARKARRRRQGCVRRVALVARVAAAGVGLRPPVSSTLNPKA